MFSVCSVVALVLSTVVAPAQPATGPVTWEADYGKALEATRHDDRPLLVVLDLPADTESAIDSEQLALKGQQGKLLSSYQLCHIDASTRYGQKVAEVFRAEQFPFTAIIDKTGSIVLCKKKGQLSTTEWEDVLATYQDGEPSSVTRHTTAYRGGSMFGGDLSTTDVRSPAYCPSCQLKARKNSGGSM